VKLRITGLALFDSPVFSVPVPVPPEPEAVVVPDPVVELPDPLVELPDPLLVPPLVDDPEVEDPVAPDVDPDLELLPEVFFDDPALDLALALVDAPPWLVPVPLDPP
jgi:hypothetical protein